MRGNEVIAFLKGVARKFKAFVCSRDALSFLFFLLLSAAFGFSNMANKTKEANITLPVRYVSLPPGYTIIDQPVREIKLVVRDEGLNLFSYSKKKLVPLEVDLSDVGRGGGQVKLLSEQILSRLSYSLHPTTSVVSFSPDSIVVRCAPLDAVTLPVKLDLDLRLERQYLLSDSIVVTPREVTAYGRRELLDRLREVETLPVELRRLKDSVDMQVSLKPIDSVSFSSSEVRLQIAVEMFTERKARVPVTFTNVPEGIDVRSFPAIVDVTYNVGLSHYGTAADEVSVVLDYRDIMKNKQEKQLLQPVCHSPKIFNVRIRPEEVEFVLERRN